MKKTVTATFLALVSLACPAAPLDFSYNFNDAPAEYYGTGKTETYDVAIRLTNPSFTGAKVTGIRVPLPDNGITDASAWISSKLQLKKKNGKNVNNPDIMSQDASVANGWLDVAFDEPYTISSDGVYVGYSFTVTSVNDATENPVAVVAGNNPDGFYLHTSRTKLRWKDMNEELGKVAGITVKLEGTFPEHSAIFTIDKILTQIDETAIVTLPVINCGTSGITSIEYNGKVADRQFNGTADLISPIGNNIGAESKANVEIPALDESGEFPIEISITKINGFPAEAPLATGTVKVYPFLPVNRPLIEEYTGLWCGWCPKGYVALETMKERKGDLFIAASYHNGDDMRFSNTPNTPGSFPSAYINRSSSIDISNIYTDWDSYRTWIPEAGIDVKVEWTDDSHSAVKATATTRFVENHSAADYRVSYILIADGLSNPEWKQHNSYSGKSEKKNEMPGELGDVFINGDDYITGLTFNDIAIAATDYDGEIGSIPNDIEANEEYVHTHTFNLEGLPEAVLTNPDQLRVIAVITNGNSGKFINCNSSALMNGKPFIDTTSVEEIHAAETPVEISRHTLDGRCIREPQPGVNIIRYSDGTVRKVLVKL